MKYILYTTILFLFTLSQTHAENWTQWRGPLLNGSSTEQNLPADWTRKENVAWVIEMPGKSGATPIIWEDRVFVTAYVDNPAQDWAYCINRKDGSVMWERQCGKGFEPIHVNTSASPSPVTDGKSVYFYFGSGQLFASDMDGKRKWFRNISKDYGPFKQKFGYSSSPLLHNNRLYIPVIHDGPSFIICLDADTGKTLWKQERKSDAKKESNDGYMTPYPFTYDGKTSIVISAANYMTGHDPDTGKEMWRSPNYYTGADHETVLRTVATTVGWKDLLFGTEPRGKAYFAVKPSGSGSLPPEAIVWRAKKFAADASTPLIYNDLLFIQDGLSRKMTCRDPKTGKALWQKSLNGSAQLFASPTGADNKIYCINNNGEVIILLASPDRFMVLNRINMGDTSSGGSIAVSNGQLFIRTNSKLWCIGKKK